VTFPHLPKKSPGVVTHIQVTIGAIQKMLKDRLVIIDRNGFPASLDAFGNARNLGGKSNRSLGGNRSLGRSRSLGGNRSLQSSIEGCP
jgi:hypothetical protein